jgi:hypothetical protein
MHFSLVGPSVRIFLGVNKLIILSAFRSSEEKTFMGNIIKLFKTIIMHNFHPLPESAW